MFFRRERPAQLTFDNQMSAVRAAGFRAESAGGGLTRIERNGVATLVQSAGPDGAVKFATRAGLVMGNEIGLLTDGGFQKFFTTPSGRRKPALAWELKELQDFQEDLREAMNLTSLYNESLGTVSNLYLYDRVVGRDQGEQKPWQVKPT
jgi:hypothetical protein